jgi:hypothetical protein
VGPSASVGADAGMTGSTGEKGYGWEDMEAELMPVNMPCFTGVTILDDAG